MVRALHFSSWFITGCIGSSLIVWLGRLHPALIKITIAIYGILAAVWVLAWLVDDAAAKFLKLELTDYYAVLFIVAASALLGGAMCWLLGG